MGVEPWERGAEGVLELPSGLRVRGRGLRTGLSSGQAPTLAVHLTGRVTEPPEWERLWIPWRDFRGPTDREAAMRTLREVHGRISSERVEIACTGGVGRTGTGLAALCVLDGWDPEASVRWVRAHHHARAVEVPWQGWFLRWVWSEVRRKGSSRR